MKNIRRTGIALGFTAAFAAASFAAISPAMAQTVSPTPVTVPFYTTVTTTTNVYDMPSTSGDLEGQLTAGQTWYVDGIDATGKWVQVLIPSSNNLPSWVPANTLALSGVTLPLSSLVTPVASATPATAAAATATPAVATSAASSPTAAPASGTPVTVPFLTTVIVTTSVYDMPSTSGDLAGQVTAGQTWFVLGTDATGKWIHLQIPSNNGLQSWVPANTVAVQGLNIPQG